MKYKKTVVKGHPFLQIAAFTVASCVACLALQKALDFTLPNPVTTQLLFPIQGSTISNTITLSCTATSTVAPITKVEFYMDGQLIGTVSNANLKPFPPSGLKFGL
jgi:hypothetical protein